MIATGLLAALLLALSRREPPPLLRAGTYIWPGYAPLYRARAAGGFSGTGVRVVEMPSGAETIRGLRSGVLEAGCLTLDEILRAQDGGCDLRIVAVVDYSAGGDALVARQGIVALSQLAGTTVGAEQGGVGGVFLARALQSVKLRLSDITPVDLEAQEHEQALLSGKVDAVVTFEPHVDRLVKGGAHVLCDSSTMTGDVIDVLVVTAEQVRNNPSAVRALADAWMIASEELRRGAEIPETARVMGLAPDELSSGLRGLRLVSPAESRALITGEEPSLLAAVRAMAQEMHESGMLRGTVNPDRLLLSREEARALTW